LPFEYLITCKAEGTTDFTILRDGKEIDMTVEMKPVPSPAPRIALNPDYFIIGGLVFTILSGPLVEEYINTVQNGNSTLRIPETVIKSGFGDRKRAANTQIVLLLRILAHEINYGYGSRNCLILDSINGTRIQNLRGLVQHVRSSDDPFLTFKFADTKRKIVLDTERARQAETEILNLHGIPSACSPAFR
jgi:hypothetical protein